MASNKSITTHNCDVCKKVFRQKSDLKKHLLIHSGEKPHQCDECGKAFTESGQLAKHIKGKHLDNKPYCCDMCDKTFVFLSALKVHIATHSTIRSFKCNVCIATFKHRANLTTHIKLKHPEMLKFKCDTGLCKGIFTTASDLQVHMLTHSRPTPQCTVCNKTFVCEGHLKSHMLIHDNAKAYSCEVCHKRFNTKDHLKSHSFIHSGVKRYSCEICEKSFTFSHTLNTHMLTHQNIKQHRCIVCDKKFRRSADLKRHLRTHSGLKPFICAFCHKRFSVRQGLQRHKLIHAGIKPFPCDVCKKRFTRRSILQNHKCRSVKYSTKKKEMCLCDVCGESFSGQETLRRHKLLPCVVKPIRPNKKIVSETCNDDRQYDHNDTKAVVKLVSFAPIYDTRGGDDMFIRTEKCDVQSQILSECQGKNQDAHRDIHNTSVLNIQSPNALLTVPIKPEIDELKLSNTVHNESNFIPSNSKNVSFNHETALKSHIEPRSSIKTAQCEVCMKTVSKPYLKRHMLTHKKTRSNVFDKYCEGFDLKLTQHMAEHSDARQYKCTSCDESFNDNSSFKRHIERHSDMKRFQCKHCDKKFFDSGALKSHLLTHSDIRTHQCDLCQKTFKLAHDMIQHRLRHSGINHQCEVCQKWYASYATLRRHICKPEKSQLKENTPINQKQDDEAMNTECGKLHAKRITLIDQKQDDEVTDTKHCSDEDGINPESFKEKEKMASAKAITKHECEICKKIFLQYSDLEHHRLLHLGVKQQCDLCGKSFSNHSSLRKHKMSLHSNRRPHICDICNKGFAQPSELKLHMLTHSNVKPHQCHVCEQTFIQASGMKLHVKRKHPEITMFKCEIGMCRYIFTNASDLEAHKSTHSGNRSTPECSVCKKTFACDAHLTRHMLSHSEIRAHACDVCHKTFKTKHNLKTHSLIHSSLKPYTCEVCDKSFRFQANLKAHMTVHLGIKPHRCTVCDQTFRTSSCLKKHSQTHTGLKPYPCNICHKHFARWTDLQRHELTHSDIKPFGPCSLCNKSFSRRQIFEQHKCKGPEILACNLCATLFSCPSALRQHEMTHTGITPYQCDVCKKSFTACSTLKQHQCVQISGAQFKSPRNNKVVIIAPEPGSNIVTLPGPINTYVPESDAKIIDMSVPKPGSHIPMVAVIAPEAGSNSGIVQVHNTKTISDIAVKQVSFGGGSESPIGDELEKCDIKLEPLSDNLCDTPNALTYTNSDIPTSNEIMKVEIKREIDETIH